MESADIVVNGQIIYECGFRPFGDLAQDSTRVA